jgi:hypothetical protein
MNKEHVISDELFNQAQDELARGNFSVAYNTINYFLDRGDMYFFKTSDEANEFAANNISEYDDFKVIHAESIVSLLRQVPYGEDLHFNLNKAELIELFESFDWREVFYDPLHDTIETSTESEKEDLAKMETLINEWESLYRRDPEEALNLAAKFWEGHPREQHKDDFIKIKIETMNENNLAYLEKQLFNLGFGDHMNAAMKKNIESERSEFNLQHTFTYGNKDMLVDLAFRRGEQNEMYFFNSYRATLKDEPNLSHTFYLDKGNAITSKEAFNLLQGRAVNKDLVNKEGEKYNAWVQLDIKGDKDLNQNFKLDRYHQNYGYDLSKSMNELILKPMSVEDDQKLYVSLLKGNVQSVTFLKNGEEVKGFIEANPKDKTINIYDGHMKPLSKEQKQDFIDHNPGQRPFTKPEVKAEEKTNGKEQKASVKKGGDDLEVSAELKKKRTRKKGNGLGV